MTEGGWDRPHDRARTFGERDGNNDGDKDDDNEYGEDGNMPNEPFDFFHARRAVECVFDQICSFGIYVIRYVMFLCFQVHFRTKQTKCFFAYAMLNIICFYVFMFSGMLHFWEVVSATTSQRSSAAFLAGKKTSSFIFGRNITRVKIVP